MKLPPRPFFPGRLPVDIFGLEPLPSLLETDEERRKRIEIVEKGCAAAFNAAVRHLGEDGARQLFGKVMRKSKRGQGKALAPGRDTELLREHDAAALSGESIRALAKRLHGEKWRKLGSTPAAIEAQLRKLLKERKARERAAAVDARRWRMATRDEAPTLLSVTNSEK